MPSVVFALLLVLVRNRMITARLTVMPLLIRLTSICYTYRNNDIEAFRGEISEESR